MRLVRIPAQRTGEVGAHTKERHAGTELAATFEPTSDWMAKVDPLGLARGMDDLVQPHL